MISDLLQGLAARGEQPAIAQVTGEMARFVTAADVARDAIALAHGLLAHGLPAGGLKAGETVALVGPNSADWVIVRLAIAAAGGLALACDDQSGADEIAAIVSHSGCRLIFASSAHAAWMGKHDAFKALDMRLLDGGEDERGWRRMMAAPAGPLPALRPDDEALVVYTSGTTGTPKSFTLTHANMAANIDAILAENLVGPGDHVLLPLPLHHVYPLLVGMLTTLASGACLVFPEAVTGPQIATALRVGKVTVMVGVPRLYAALLAGIEGRVAARGRLAAFVFHTLLAASIAARRRFGWRLGRRLFGTLHRQLGGHLRLMASGGAKLEGEIVWRLEGLGWQTLSGYGLAETASMFTANLPRRQKIGSEGRPIGQGQIRIAPVKGDGLDDAGETGTGEIQLKGQSVFAGYRDNPEANAVAFTEDGWFRTGDLGFLDADGYIYVTGRAKEMIVLGGGKNIYPEEVERHYAANPYIRELAVLEREGKLVALVLPDMATLRAAGLTRAEDAVRIALAEGSQGLPSYQRIAGFALVREPVPRTRLGKYRRFLLPSLYDAASRGVLPAPARELSDADKALIVAAPARDAWAFLKARYADRGIGMDSNLALDLGIDSLEWMTVAIELESRLAVHVDEAMLQKVETVRDLLTEIAKAEPVSTASVRSEAAVAAEADRWLAPTGPLLTFAGACLYGLNWLLMHGLFRLRTEAANHVPATGPVLIVANHASDLDPPMLGAALPLHRLQNLYWAGDVGRLFGNALGRAFARAARIFPVDEHSAAATLAMARAVLQRGLGLVWFPESWRTPDGRLQKFLPGVGLLLAEEQVTVVPAYIHGTFQALPRQRRWPKLVRVTITFGTPISAADIRELAGQEDGPQRLVALLQDRVAALQDKVITPET